MRVTSNTTIGTDILLIFPDPTSRITVLKMDMSSKHGTDSAATLGRFLKDAVASPTQASEQGNGEVDNPVAKGV
jgi:hypothetical protein